VWRSVHFQVGFLIGTVACCSLGSVVLNVSRLLNRRLSVVLELIKILFVLL